MKANGEFIPACQSDTGVRLSTRSCFAKVAIRHSDGYHQLLNVQSWIRLPFGLTYSLIPLAAGAGAMVGGCMLDAAANDKGALCQLSVIGGVALMRTAPVVMEGALRLDLRHWEHVPAAFVATRASTPELDPSWRNLELLFSGFCRSNPPASIKKLFRDFAKEYGPAARGGMNQGIR